MKKLVTIFALFTMVMLTSFVEPSDIGGSGVKGSTTTLFAGEIGGSGVKGSTTTLYTGEIGGSGVKGSTTTL